MGFHPDSTSRASASTRLNAAARQGRRRQALIGRRAIGSAVEALEPRQLLAVVNSGESAFFYNGTNTYKITVGGTGAFTFTAAVHPAMGGGVTLAEVPLTTSTGRSYAGGYRTTAPTAPPGGGGTAPELPKFDIYSIVGTNTSVTTTLTISQYTVGTAPSPSFSTPYSGDAGSILTNMVPSGPPITLSLTNGGVFIGGRSNDQGNAPVNVVRSLVKRGDIASAPGYTLKSGRSYTSGIYTDGAVGKIFVGGTISGRIEIGGSLGTMYAGNIITGDPASGNDAGTNFTVAGDLRNLVVSGNIGTLDGAPGTFVPNTGITVAGRVGQVKAGGEFRAGLTASGSVGKKSLVKAVARTRNAG